MTTEGPWYSTRQLFLRRSIQTGSWTHPGCCQCSYFCFTPTVTQLTMFQLLPSLLECANPFRSPDISKLFTTQIFGNKQLDAIFHVFIYFMSLHFSSVTALFNRRSNYINPLKSNDLKKRRTAQLTSRCCILHIYSTNIRTEYFKHAAHSPFFSLQNAVYFIMLHFLVPVLFTF